MDGVPRAGRAPRVHVRGALGSEIAGTWPEALGRGQCRRRPGLPGEQGCPPGGTGAPRRRPGARWEGAGAAPAGRSPGSHQCHGAEVTCADPPGETRGWPPRLPRLVRPGPPALHRGAGASRAGRVRLARVAHVPWSLAAAQTPGRVSGRCPRPRTGPAEPDGVGTLVWAADPPRGLETEPPRPQFRVPVMRRGAY